MTLIAVLGDHTTTTSVALSATWPGAKRVTIVEADPRGGSLAAWLDTPSTPSLSTIVATPDLLANDARNSRCLGDEFDAMIQLSRSGVRFIAAPTRATEAGRALSEATRTLFPVLSTHPDLTALADLGRWNAADGVPRIAQLADTIVLCHAQREGPAAAAAVRLERLGEQVALLESTDAKVVIAVIGDRPFDIDEIARFVSNDGSIQISIHHLAHDALAAAVLGGRTGVSQRRLARLPLMRTARELGTALQRTRTSETVHNDLVITG